MDKKEKATAKKCEECGKTIRGRLDKRFCDANCRNSFNNKLKRTDEQYILDTNRRLRKNRRILKTLSPIGKSTVRREVLEAMGYDFTIFSSMYRSQQGLIYYLCYDYGFSPIIDKKNIDKALIINRQDYMVNWQPWKYVKQQGQI